MAATEMLAVLDAPEAFLKRLKNPFICRGIQRKVLILLLNLDYIKKHSYFVWVAGSNLPSN